MIVLATSCGRIAFDPTRDGAVVDDAIADAASSLDDSPIDAPAMACSAAGLTCSTPEVVTCGTKCYVTCPDVVNQQTANTACQAWGGRLAITDTAAELACLSPITNDAWIGLVQTNVTGFPGFGWFWQPGMITPGMSFWIAGEPDDVDTFENGQEQCALNSSGGWLDTACSELKVFACSRPVP